MVLPTPLPNSSSNSSKANAAMATMQAVEITAYGAPEVLQLCERPRPEAGAGELLIRVAASGVNRPDVLQRTGNYPVPPGASDIPGLEVAGVIESGDAAALQAAGLKVGDRVCALVAGGGYAELCTAPIAQCLPYPLLKRGAANIQRQVESARGLLDKAEHLRHQIFKTAVAAGQFRLWKTVL